MDEGGPNLIKQTPENKEKLSLRILVAEDREDVRNFLKDLLEYKGHKVTTVENGQLLVNKLLEEGQSFDLITTDNQMPEKNGMEAITEIRSNEKFKKIPIILISGDGFGKEEKRMLKENLGADYIEKPFQEEELFEMIEKSTQKS